MRDYILEEWTKKRLGYLWLPQLILVEEARRIHAPPYSHCSFECGALTAAAMLGMTMKGDRDILTFRLKGDGPIGNIVTVANSKGQSQRICW